MSKPSDWAVLSVGLQVQSQALAKQLQSNGLSHEESQFIRGQLAGLRWVVQQAEPEAPEQFNDRPNLY
jgi:hypothetical protein